KFCFGSHLKGHDAWGYSNAHTLEIAAGNIQTTIPEKEIIQPRYYFDLGGCSNFISDVYLKIGNEEPVEAASNEFMQRGILKRIVYPTGGFADFDFEANQYARYFEHPYITQLLPQQSGGLRIRSINYYEAGEDTPVNQKYYKYGEMEDGNGVLVNQPRTSWDPSVYSWEPTSYLQKMVYLRGSSSSGPCFNRGCLTILAVESKTTYEPARSEERRVGKE